MADKSTQMVLDALSRAVADPAGLPLFGGKSEPALFAATTPAKSAAQRCKDDGLLRVVRSEAKGKSVREICTLTEKGLSYLLSQVSPRQVLEDVVRALEARQAQLDELVSTARQTQASLDAFKSTAEKVLQQLHKPAEPMPASNGVESWVNSAVSYLAHWQAKGTSEDCPLPELFHQAHQSFPTLSIGKFHDGLRRLHDQEQIYLHPWTGPLYDIPEPPYALLIGHEIAYYASLRK